MEYGKGTWSLVLIGYVLSFLLSFGVGGNNVANTFGTVVASKSVHNNGNQRIMGVLFEMLGAFLTYFFMTNAYDKKGLIDYSQCEGSEDLLIKGSVATIAATCIWLYVWTFFGYPVSVTHCLLGAALGASYNINCILIHRKRVFYLYSWTWLVPMICGGLSVALMFTLEMSWIKVDRLGKKIRTLSLHGSILIIGVVIFACIFLEPPDTLLYFIHTSILDSQIGAFVALFITCLSVPILLYNRCCVFGTFAGTLEERLPNILPIKRISGLFKKLLLFRVISLKEKRITRVSESEGVQIGNEEGGSAPKATPMDMQHSEIDNDETACCDIQYINHTTILDINRSEDVAINQPISLEATRANVETPDDKVLDPFDGAQQNDSQDSTAEKISPRFRDSEIYRKLLLLTTVGSCIGRGGHDVSNAIAPLFVLVTICDLGMSSITTRSDVPIFILVIGLFGIIIGMLTWWFPVMDTICNKLVNRITHFSGFCMEFGLVLTIVVCSKFVIPISMTYCKVITMASVCYMEGKLKISLLKEILLVWFVTVPGTFFLGLMFYGVLN